MRTLAILAAVACLSGCDMIGAGLTPIPKRVNAAFLLSDELQLARNRLLAELGADPPAQAQATEQLAHLMNARAYPCSASTPVVRFDTVDRIRAS